MMKPEEKNWDDFRLGDLADVDSGHDIYAQERIPGETPYVTAGTANNGIGYFVGNENDSMTENAISVNRNGAVGEAFYHPYKALYGNDCRRVSFHDARDENSQLFATLAISQQKTTFSYSRKLGSARLRDLKFLLPDTNNGNPDINYMKSYTAKKKKELIDRYTVFIKKQLSELVYRDIPKLNEKNWDLISISGFFDFVRGRENNMAMLEDGNVPLVSAKNTNNGLKGFVESSNKKVSGGCITLNNDGDGGAGLAYFQPFTMALDTHVTALVPKEEMSKFVLIFIAECLSGLHGFFGHGLSISNDRAKKIKVMLPVDDKGKVDYDFMDRYAMNMMIDKYTQYLSFKGIK